MTAVTEKPTITLCMIAKDEEDHIGKTIRSVKDLVSEIILVDTGSTDKTVQIAKELGAKVLFQPWEDDFAKPRNFSIEQATSDWILVLDADEGIDKRDHRKIKELIKIADRCYQFPQYHYSNDHRISDYYPCKGAYPKWEKKYNGYFKSYCCRLFPRKSNIRFEGRIHELVEHSIERDPALRLALVELPIHHYGHTDEVKKKKKKGKLYTPLGEQKASEKPTDWKSFFELGVEHNCNGRKKESVEAFVKALELNPKYVPAWTNYGYVLCELAEYDKALSALQNALKLDPKSPDAHCNASVVYMRTRQWELAEKHLRHVIQIKPDYANAYCNLAETYMHMNRPQDAQKITEHMLHMFPNSTVGKTNLALCHYMQRRPKQAKELLLDVTKDGSGASRSYYYLGQVCAALNETSEAVKNLKQFCDMEEQGDGNTDNELLSHVKNTIASLEQKV